MPLDGEQAAAVATRLHSKMEADRSILDQTRLYWTGRQRLPQVVPSGAASEVYEMARMSRVNVCDIVVESLAQSLFAEGFRMPRTAGNIDVWQAWQANSMDARQSGIHRAALAYGVAYAVVMPARPLPRIRGVSPRKLYAEYTFDDDWPVRALERRGQEWRLYDAEAIYTLSREEQFVPRTRVPHSFNVVPVVRYVDVWDLDVDDEVADQRQLRLGGHDQLTVGQVGKLQPLQDQIDFTTFNLLVAMHYQAFKQRYIIGWTADSEEKALKTAASKLWTFKDTPETIEIGEFSQVELDGYIKSREASLRHAATLSQTPVHELIGELVNLSAEALAAAEAGRDRKVDDRKTLFGEAHEQTLRLVGKLMGVQVPVDAQMVWRDTTARALGAVVDALGKMAQMLGIPPEELWERIPGTTQADVERYRAAKTAQMPEDEPEDEPEETPARPIPVAQ